jgi:hypothetical protein
LREKIEEEDKRSG